MDSLAVGLIAATLFLLAAHAGVWIKESRRRRSDAVLARIEACKPVLR